MTKNEYRKLVTALIDQLIKHPTQPVPGNVANALHLTGYQLGKQDQLKAARELVNELQCNDYRELDKCRHAGCNLLHLYIHALEQEN